MDVNINDINEGHIGALLAKITNEYLLEKQSPFKENQLGQYVRAQAPRILKSLPFIDESFTVKGSVGQGNWAQVPWIAILHTNVTTSTQRGYYLGYLFSEDMKRVYLTFAQGITETSKKEMERIKHGIRDITVVEDYNTSTPIQRASDIDLGQSSKGKGYQESTALYIKYDRDHLPDEEALEEDLRAMVEIYKRFVSINQPNIKENQSEELDEWSNEKIVEHIHSYIQGKGFFYKLDDIKNLFLSLRTKPFVILSGISGTGKTKIMELFAESVGATDENGRFRLVPVRPDWSDGSDLLGYTDIKGEFQKGPLLTVIEEASQDPSQPYFVVLDEMNLARVEYYFSDFLSVIESRKWHDGEVVSASIMDETQIGRKVTIPSNLYIVGTVNMDETTHPFSKKVLDRANTIECNDVHLDWFFFLEEEEVSHQPLALPNHRLTSKYLRLKDAYSTHKDLIQNVTTELVKLNQLLEPIQAHVGYRVRDEICFYVIYSRSLFSLEEALDYQFYQKILPRLTASHGQSFQVLKNLFTYFTNQQYNEDLTTERVHEMIKTARFPRSAEKVHDMLVRGDLDGFTSFWSS
ncbi:McrB family protein [Pontibacillus salipaludis]|uniref:DUF3578 domain-containing protein n=1 Tax=Pontibacillus salipaludis TaxID=1697394 RepID=A0ABQ1Q0P0_9BACI|nr:DUF3578 domain-containing protein [Pontibacillus salipaludis]GGD08363.1 hypothetical protein GCM10011389_14920 [Pontibacillus salipaludis]